MATSQDLVNWVCSDALEPHFLKYAFLNEGRDGLPKSGEGTVPTTIDYPAVKAFHVALPPTAEQRRIVDRLDDLLARADLALRALAVAPTLLDQLRQSVLAAAFRGDLTAAWREAHPDFEPAAVLLERIRAERRRRLKEVNPKKKYEPPAQVDVEAEGLPGLPAGWEWATLEELTDSTRLIQYGILKPCLDFPGGIPYVKVRDMKGEVIDVGGLHRTSPETHAQYSRSALGRGDLLLSIRGCDGGVALVPDKLVGANITQDSARIAPLPGVDRHFLRANLRSPACQAYFNEVAKGKAVRGVNIGDLRPTRVPFAALAEQVEVVRRVEVDLAAARAAEAKVVEMLKNLAALGRSTLAKAYRGGLTHPEARSFPIIDTRVILALAGSAQ